MPPSTPPNGTYTSALSGGLSSWSGSFTYTDGAIAYTRTSPSETYTTSNTSNGNAIVFSISDGTTTVHFNGGTHVSLPSGKSKYTGNANDGGPAMTQDAWTATQD